MTDFFFAKTGKHRHSFQWILAVVLFIAAPVFARGQQPPANTFYKTEKGPYWTKSQLDSFLITRNNNRYKLIPKVTGISTFSDSEVYKINLLLDPAPVDYDNEILTGRSLPSFDFLDINGKKVSSKQLIGKPLVINFWFASCIPCIQEMPALNSLRQRYSDSGVVFLAITFDDRAIVQQFLRKHQFYFTVIAGQQTYCSQMTTIYPLTLFVSKQGIIAAADHYMPSYELENGKNIFDTYGYEKNIESIISNR